MPGDDAPVADRRLEERPDRVPLPLPVVDLAVVTVDPEP